ncbi:MAG: hypothetical protein HQL93_12340, partial [Magnetococcales bacterium]|nr:hypothetical protein [Magnetococcales bacterium]
MSDNVKDIPIVSIDMRGFSLLRNVPEQRASLGYLDDVLFRVFKQFTGYQDPRRVFVWQSTGDGYFIAMNASSTPVAMRFAVDLESALKGHNKQQPDF